MFGPIDQTGRNVAKIFTEGRLHVIEYGQLSIGVVVHFAEYLHHWIRTFILLFSIWRRLQKGPIVHGTGFIQIPTKGGWDPF